jgi:hypothetical protein
LNMAGLYFCKNHTETATSTNVNIDQHELRKLSYVLWRKEYDDQS